MKKTIMAVVMTVMFCVTGFTAYKAVKLNHEVEGYKNELKNETLRVELMNKELEKTKSFDYALGVVLDEVQESQDLKEVTLTKTGERWYMTIDKAINDTVVRVDNGNRDYVNRLSYKIDYMIFGDNGINAHAYRVNYDDEIVYTDEMIKIK